MTCIITLSNGKKEFPIIGVPENGVIDLKDYQCSCIQKKDLPRLKDLTEYPLFRENASLLVDVLEKGLEIHLWLKK